MAVQTCTISSLHQSRLSYRLPHGRFLSKQAERSRNYREQCFLPLILPCAHALSSARSRTLGILNHLLSLRCSCRGRRTRRIRSPAISSDPFNTRRFPPHRYDALGVLAGRVPYSQQCVGRELDRSRRHMQDVMGMSLCIQTRVYSISRVLSFLPFFVDDHQRASTVSLRYNPRTARCSLHRDVPRPNQPKRNSSVITQRPIR